MRRMASLDTLKNSLASRVPDTSTVPAPRGLYLQFGGKVMVSLCYGYIVSSYICRSLNPRALKTLSLDACPESLYVIANYNKYGKGK
jgi:hypothetical protein